MGAGDEFQADPGVLDNVAKMLRSGGGSLNDLAGSVPDVPDAGDMSGQMAAVLAHQVQAAGELAVGVGAAAAAVSESARSYAESDEAAKRSLPHVH